MRSHILKYFVVTMLMMTSWAASYAQVLKFSDNPATYAQELSDQVALLNDPVAAEVHGRFMSVWPTLTESQQKIWIKLSQTLLVKKVRLKPHFIDAMDVVNFAVQIRTMNGPDLDELLNTLQKSAEKYDTKRSSEVFKQLAQFLQTGAIFSSNYHKYIVQEGSFKITFKEAAPMPTDEEEDYSAIIGSKKNDQETTTEGSEEEWGNKDDFTDNAGEWDEPSDENWGTTEETSAPTSENVTQAQIDQAVVEASYIPPINPPLDGPIIELKGINLILSTPNDTNTLSQIGEATFLLNNKTFIGKGGRFDWKSAGLPPEVNGEFKEYNFQVTAPTIQAEGFTLTYPGKLSAPVEGVFEYSSRKVKDKKNAIYPRFMSYKSDVEIMDLGEEIKYHGGFSLNGSKVYSTSLSEGKATIEVFFQGERKFKALAKHFVLGDSIISGYPAFLSIYVKSDSIYHPGVRLQYNRSSQDLKLFADKGGFKEAPFIDSYHNMEMDVDAMLWNLKDSLMNFTVLNARSEIPAFFDSKDSYHQEKYIQLKGLAPFHPLQIVMNYYNKTKQKAFHVTDLATSTKQNLNAIKGSMYNLMVHNYIDYNPKSGLIILKDKAFHYVEASRLKRDYDVIHMKSLSPSAYNASLNLTTNELIVRGVDKVYLSDSLDVYYSPDNKEVRISKNRKMTFNGLLHTKDYLFKGKNFKFDYNEFSIDMEQIDAIELLVQLEDSVTGKKKSGQALGNNLSNTSGKLWLDEPENKATRKRNPEYPHFDSNRGAYVYFSKKEILNFAYDSSVYFAIPLFKTDSLSSGHQTSVNFDGDFVSGGIFPKIKEHLNMMYDNSLGFIHAVPEEGYQLYGGKGKFFGSIVLSNQGIRGNGVIKFLNTTVESQDFIFYPDSVVGKGTVATTVAGGNPEIAQGITFPDVNVKAYELKWLARKDSMYLKNATEPFKIFEGTADFDGKLIITTSGMYGSGKLDTRGSRCESIGFSFSKDGYVSRNAKFEILTEVADKPALRSNKVKVDFDLIKGEAQFSPERKGFASNEFPYLQYKSSLDNGLWDIKKRTVTMSMPEGSDINKSFFYSTHKDQDSIVFNAERAVYSMDSLSLYVAGVPHINIADAKIIPGKNELYIKENAQIQPIHDAVIIIDTLNEYHRLTKGNITIKTKSKFEGNAYYEYVNFQKDTLEIKFNSFELVETEISKKKKEIHTVSDGVILEEDSFYLAPKMQYRGKATMYADKRLLSLDGAIHLQLGGVVKTPDWLKYKNDKDVDQIRINTEDQDNLNGQKLYNGFHYSPIDQRFYGTFFGKKESQTDPSAFEAKGYLEYDLENGEFEISTLERLKNESYEGALFSYNAEKEVFHGIGELKLLHGSKEDDKNAEMHFSGYMSNGINDSSFNVRGMMLMNFNIPPNAVDKMGYNLSDIALMLGAEKGVNVTDTLLMDIANLSTNKEASSFAQASRKSYMPLHKVSQKFTKGIVISEINLKWSKEQKSWYSVGKIGLSNVGTNDINAMVNGYMEVKNSLSGSVINLYLELNSNAWYFFSYKGNALTAIGTNKDFNSAITSKSTMAKSQVTGSYYFASATDSDKEDFITYFVQTYLGGKALEGVRMNQRQSRSDDEIEDAFEEETSNEESTEQENVEEVKSDSKKSKSKDKKKKSSDEKEVTKDAEGTKEEGTDEEEIEIDIEEEAPADE